MSNYSAFFLNTNSDIIQLELLEISHPNFSKVYRIVRNAINGVTVTHEDASVHTYDYYPLQITQTGVTDDLDQTLAIQLGDLGQVVPTELDLVNAAAGLLTKPTLLYRTYRHDDLTQPLFGPLRFIISNIAFTDEGSALNAGAPKLNQSSTGEIYTLDRFPMLKGFM